MKRPLGAATLIFVFLARLFLALMPYSPGELSAYTQNGEALPIKEGETYLVTGCVYRVETHVTNKSSLQWIYLDSVTFKGAGSQEAALSSRLICKTAEGFRPKIGSRVQITGQFSYFTQAANPGEFDSARYYHILGIGGSLRKAVILKADRSCSRIREDLFCLQNFWRKKLYACFPEKEASVLSAMLLGDKTLLDEETEELYRRNGIIHILSISGLHITIIGMGLYKLLRKAGCPIFLASPAAGAVLLLYGIMTGMGISTCRAAGMFLIRMLGELSGRTYDMLTALAVMAVMILIRQPEYLLHSGFLLSFCSVCGIGLLMPALKQALPALPAFLAPGAAIGLFTLPIQLVFYYEIPVYAVFLNLLVLPFMSIVMGIGLAVVLIPGAAFLAPADCFVFSVYERLCGFFERLPGHTWRPGHPAAVQVIAFYLILIVFLLWKGRGAGKKIRCILPALAVLILTLRFRPELKVTFLDVGQGDGICVQTAGGEVYLFDGGSSSRQNVGTYTLLPYLKYEGINHIDAVFLSHPDADHINGVLELISRGEKEGISVERLFLPDIAPQDRNEDFGRIWDAVENAPQGSSTTVSYLSEGAVWQSGDTVFTCLHPPAGKSWEDANSYSQCFLIEQGAFSMLLTGDVQGTGEEALYEVLSEKKISDITLLKAAHHGSRNSTPMKLLALLKPRITVISCGADNSYGHPHEELLERLNQAGCRIYITARSGALTVETGKRKVHVVPYLKAAEESGQFPANQLQ